MSSDVKNWCIPEMKPLRFWGLVVELSRGWFKMGDSSGLMDCGTYVFPRRSCKTLSVAIIPTARLASQRFLEESFNA